MNCLICQNETGAQVGWRMLLSKMKENYICERCCSQLVKIEGETCEICDRPLSQLEDRFKEGTLCYDCIRWEDDKEWSGYLTRNHSVFLYNEFLKEIIAQFKFRGDYILAKAFYTYIQTKMDSINYDMLVPIPLSEERLFERGFNQAEALIRESGLTSSNILKRTHTEKQSKKSRSERIHLPQVFELSETSAIHNKKILLIDDIYTTGSTLRHAAKILKEAGAQTVCSLTLARG